MRFDSSGDRYPITKRPTTINSSSSTFVAMSKELWHNHLRHPSTKILILFKETISFYCNKLQKHFFCHIFSLWKQIKLPCYESFFYTMMHVDIVHSDIWRSPILSPGGHCYYDLFLDDFTNFIWTFPISNKSQVKSMFIQFCAHIKTQFQWKIKWLQGDNNAYLYKFCDLNGMTFRFYCPYTSPLNGKSKRKIYTMNNIIRTLLVHAPIPPHFWYHALKMATYYRKILPNKKLAL